MGLMLHLAIEAREANSNESVARHHYQQPDRCVVTRVHKKAMPAAQVLFVHPVTFEWVVKPRHYDVPEQKKGSFNHSRI